MGSLDAVEWEACLLEPLHDRDAERELRRVGFVPPAAEYFLDVPWLPMAMASMNLSSLPLVHIDGELTALISIVVSQDNACRYCYAVTRGVLKIAGYPEEPLRRLEEDLLTAELPPQTLRALELARRVSRAVPLPGRADAEALLAAGTERLAVVEVAAHAALNVFYNRMATLPALPPAPMESLGDRWWVRLARPLIRWKLQPPRSQPVPLPPDKRTGPFAPLINALDGLPLALRLREVVDQAWASSVLSRRAKALIFAVVARGLGCPLSEDEALAILEAEGTGRDEAQDILTHLGGPGLDPVERILVPFARETIWYRPATLQRQARTVMESLSRAQFVELIGAAALANTLCRLSLAVALQPH